MKTTCFSILILVILCTTVCAQVSINYGNGLPATDALGRKLPLYEETGPKKDKYVAVFYWTWHQGNDDTTYQVKNITEIVRQYPEAMKDYHHPAWGDKRPGLFFWEQPLLGYYKTTDPWVLRKHAEMLADAGVDAVFFDCTNGSLTWVESYEALMKTWDQAEKDGVKVPKIAYMLPFGPRPQPHSLISLRQLYRDIYKPGRYKNLWFTWKGKPCIMGYPDDLTDSAEDREIAAFFTFRPCQPDYVNGPKRNDQWGWLENYPQHGYVKGADGRFEQVPVGVAQNAAPSTNGHASAFNLPGSYGRSFSQRNGFDPRPEGYLYGWNFQEQWERAFELDPELVFVTGWNEYIAGQYLPEHSWTGDPFSFVDEFDWDRSRDIEPNRGWGDRGDVYYYQLIHYVRKFKGLDAPAEKTSPPKTVALGKASEWEDVTPFYRHYRGNTLHRDHRGRYDRYYVNTTGRNDIVGAKVARDDASVYFYVETDAALTPKTDRNWMMLFIDIDRNQSTGWNGYDYVVNRVTPGKKAVIEKNVGGRWEWEPASTIDYAVTGNRLELKIPRSALGLSGKAIDLEFKWNDNMQENGNIMDFYVNGDTAPGGRFNFRYRGGTL